MKKKGFTLIELMVVIAIIAVLAAIMAPQIFRQVAKGRVGAAEGFYNAVKVGATSYFSDLGIWPAQCFNAACNTATGANGGFVTAPTVANPDWDGPYIDRWAAAGGNPFRGNYNWYNAAAGNIFNVGGATAGERYITITNVTTSDARRIDSDLDRTSVVAGAGNGLVRRMFPNNTDWPAAGATIVTVGILVSRDGPVN